MSMFSGLGLRRAASLNPPLSLGSKRPPATTLAARRCFSTTAQSREVRFIPQPMRLLFRSLQILCGAEAFLQRQAMPVILASCDSKAPAKRYASVGPIRDGRA